MEGERGKRKKRNDSLLFANMQECCPVGDIANHTVQDRTRLEHLWPTEEWICSTEFQFTGQRGKLKWDLPKGEMKCDPLLGSKPWEGFSNEVLAMFSAGSPCCEPSYQTLTWPCLSKSCERKSIDSLWYFGKIQPHSSSVSQRFLCHYMHKTW